MEFAKPLPSYLVKRYHGWKATQFEENKGWYARLADEGQRPRAMVISCCDSRVHVTSVFEAETGEFFIHRNIANLVPPYAPDRDHHGTSAAIEYAVIALKVINVIVIGHSSCGGVKACHAMCSGTAPELDSDSSFIGRWMDILRPGFERIDRDGIDEQAQVTALERECVIVSLENLMTFPFVETAVKEGSLSLHGLWMDIRNGGIEGYDGKLGEFVPL